MTDNKNVLVITRVFDAAGINKFVSGEIKWLKGDTEGWANFLACLKAYLEYGINLRKGAFDFLRKDKR